MFWHNPQNLPDQASKQAGHTDPKSIVANVPEFTGRQQRPGAGRGQTCFWQHRVFFNAVAVLFSLFHPLTCLVSCFLLQVLTAIYPAPPVALPTGVVSVTPVPPAGAAPAQDVANPPSPLAVGLQGSAVATPQPGMGTEVEVKHESQLDAQSDAQGLSSCVTSSSTGTCTSSIIAGNGPLI